MKMRRFQVTVSVGISAKNEKEAQRIMRQIVESGRAGGSTPGAIAQIVLKEDPIVEKELPF